MKYSLNNIPMKNYLIASSSPLTESVERLICCKEAGFSAAILKSCADYIRSDKGYGRKVIYTDEGYYADSSFEKEILTLEEGISLFSESHAQIKEEMHLIPSISASSLLVSDWLPICKAFESYGASILQLDFFYLGTLNHNEQFYKGLHTLLTTLTRELSCSIMPKLSVRFSAEHIFYLLKDCGITMVSLLDSMRELPPSGHYNLHKDTTSYFGPRQFPYTLRYLDIGKRAGLQICAGGGVSSKLDINTLLDRGADMIQVASYVLNRDFSHVMDLLPDTDVPNKKPLLKHNPWCDYPRPVGCDKCGACANHIIPVANY